jgi:mono/diheme cytochrome c family protein
MRDMRVMLGLAALAAGLVIGPSAAPAASAEKGKTAFIQHGCWQCHGTQGQGSSVTSAGKVLAPDPMPYEAFAAFVRTTNRAMPPYREPVLPDADLADIYAYLQSVPKAADYKTIPLLNQ